MAIHRYWRLYITSCNGSGYPDAETIALLSGGVSVATVPAQAYASSSYSDQNFAPSVFAAANAVAGQAGDWSAATIVPAWWGYDFASSPQDITAVSVTNRSNAPNWTTDSFAQSQVQWSDDNANWTTAFSGSMAWTAPSQTLSYAAPATPTIGAPSVSGLVAGGTTTLNGPYANGTPGGLTYSLDGAAAVTVAAPTISGGTYSFAITTPAAGSHTVAVTGTGGNTATSATTAFTTTAPSVTIAPNNAAIVYSPYNWQVTATSATTWNPGAYFRTLFSGASCTLTFDISVAVVPYSQFWWRIDNGPWTLASVAASVALNIPAITTNNAAVPFHRLEVVVKSMDIASGVNRWAAASPGAVRFTGIMLATGASLLAPGRAPLNVLIYGDSITEGARTLGEANPTVTPNDMDAMFGWAFAQRDLLGAEVGIVGFSGTGYLTPVYSVPAFPNSFNLLAAGVARSFVPAPNLVVINHGQNDGTSDVTAAAVSAVNGVLAACPTAKVVLLNPLPPADSAFLPAVPTACSAPSRVSWMSTSGFFDKSKGADAALIHPSGPNSVTLIAPKVAAVLRPVLLVTPPRWTH